MSGILSQVGFAEELETAPAISSITSTATAFTVTFASAHGLQASDTLTLVGFTPSAYNGSWTVATAPTTTTLTVLTSANPGNASVVGTFTASLFGRAQTVTRFYDFNSETLKYDVARIESAGLRASTRVQRADRFVVNPVNCNGDTIMEVQSRGFGIFLKHMLGAIATAGPTDSAYTHTATVGVLRGKSLTCQVGRPFTPSAVVQPFTYEGLKVNTWELSCAVDGMLELKLSFVGMDEKTTVPLAAASYVVTELLSFAGAVITVGGVNVDVTKFVLTGDNKLDDKRRYLRGSTLIKEPIEAAMRDYLCTLDLDFTDLSHYTRYTSATASGAQAAITATFTAPTLIGSTTFPSLVVTIPAARQDGTTPNVPGPSLLVQSLPFKVLADAAGDSPLTLAYTTLDATP